MSLVFTPSGARRPAILIIVPTKRGLPSRFWFAGS